MTAKPQFLRIKNWEKFQHYKNRRPPWIKYHVETLDDWDLMHLSNDAQLVYDRLLLLAARTDNNIPHDPEWVGGQIVQPPELVQRAVETLIAAGFVTVAGRKRSASKAIAARKQTATTEAEAEAEAEERQKQSRDDALPDESLEELGQRLNGHATAKYGDETRLLEILTDQDKNTMKVLRPLLDKLPGASLEQCRAEVLAKQPRRPTAYAVEILTSMVEKRRRAA